MRHSDPSFVEYMPTNVYWCAGYLVPYAVMLGAQLLHRQQLQHQGSAGRSLWHLHGCTPALWALFAFVMVTCYASGPFLTSVHKADKITSHLIGSSKTAPQWGRIAKMASSVWPQQTQSLSMGSTAAAVLASGSLLVGDAAVMFTRHGTCGIPVALIGLGGSVGVVASAVYLYTL